MSASASAPCCPTGRRGARSSSTATEGPARSTATQSETCCWSRSMSGPATSAAPPLLVPGPRDALHRTKARRVFLATLAPQVAETRHLDLDGHVQAFLDHGGVADVIVFDPDSALGVLKVEDIPAVAAAVEDPA